MKKVMFVFLLLYAAFSKAVFTFQEAEEFYKKGQYKLAQRAIRSIYPDANGSMISNQQAQKAQLLLLAMGDFKDFGPAEEQFKNNIKVKAASLLTQVENEANKRLALIVQALWAINRPLDEEAFPEKYAQLFTGQQNLEQGISILEALNNKHTTYMLSRIHLRLEETNFEKRVMGNDYLKKAAALDHEDAQDTLRRYGINYEDENQFFDHCKCWVCYPNCEGATSFGKMIRACIGCGPANDKLGWIACNFCLGGFSTELNCSSLARYSNDGFFSLLKAIDLPLRMCAACNTTAAAILQGTGSRSPAAFPLIITAAALSALVAFVRQ